MLTARYSEQELKDNSLGGSTTVAPHTKMRLISKVEQNMRQQQRENNNVDHSQSLNSPMTIIPKGDSVGIEDKAGNDLLTPMRSKTDLESTSALNMGKDSHSRPERNLWSRAEMLEMLHIMQQINALEQLNDRNVKSEHIFRQIEELMRIKGYVKKSSIQIWTKWKFLKSTYNTTTRHGNGIPKVVPEEVYRVLCRMLTNDTGSFNVNSSVSTVGSEGGNSLDSSNTELSKALRQPTEPKDDSLGVEHPIFGFRLGLVKPEPVDTGYESVVNQSSSPPSAMPEEEQPAEPEQSLVHMPFMITVKNEPEMDLGMDGTNTPPPTAPTSPSPPTFSRDNRERTTSTPLRVASFAHDTAQRVPVASTHGVLQIERPTSNTTLPLKQAAAGAGTGAGRGNRTLPLHSTSSINFVHPTRQLMLPRKQMPLRLPKDISVQPASSRAMKPVPIRETGYSLRPDRMIPNLDQSISPPESPSPPPLHAAKLANKFQLSFGPNSSRQMQFPGEQSMPRKRRLHPNQAAPVAAKFPRISSSTLETNAHPSYGQERESSAEDQKLKVAAEESNRRRQQQDEIFKKELGQLANAMRSAQSEMMGDFFAKQKQLSRREHEFQLRQDNRVMSALRQQTEALVRAARDLLLQSGQRKTHRGTSEQTEQLEESEAGNHIETITDEPEIQLPMESQMEVELEAEEEHDVEAAEFEDDEAEEDEDEETQYSEDEANDVALEQYVTPNTSDSLY